MHKHLQASGISAIALAIAILLTLPVPAFADSAQPVLVDIKRMSLDTALKLAQASIKACRKEGVQVAVTVVDRGGHAQVVLRDVLAQDLTLEISKQKAYTAMTFNSATSAMAGRFKDPFSIGKIQGIVISAGGLPITAGGNIIGGVGVSGAPSGETDEKCAKAGIDAIHDDLEMAATE
jgi:uncharacterized protein GlcG (DUF336 family)